jgi:hypothetical protein
VKRRNEGISTITIFSDTTAVDCGAKAAQLFIGRTSLLANVNGIYTKSEIFPQY